MHYRFIIASFVLSLIAASFAAAQDEPAPKHVPRKLPGMQKAGEILLPTQWSLRPAGEQIKLGDFPVNLAVHPSKKWVVALHCGYGDHELIVVSLASKTVVSRTLVPQSFYGLCFSPDGTELFASGGEYEVIHRFAFDEGLLGKHRELRLADRKETLVPAGLSTSSDGQTLFVACAWGGKLAIVPLGESNTPRMIDLGEESYPYLPLLSKDGQRLYVSLWGKAEVAVIDLAQGKAVARWPVQSHPTEMRLSLDESTLYVACADNSSAVALDTQSGKSLEVIASSLYPQASNGSTPNSLALSDDGNALFIANADNNNLAVFDVSQRGRAKSLGFVPVGWYPTSVRLLPDGRILVANGKGLMSTANRQGPNPLNEPPKTVREYIGGLFRGTLSVINSPSPRDMARLTREAFECSPLREDQRPRAAEREEGNPIPAKVGDPSPIKYCIYIIKENRTYDQVFGDVPKGNGDPHLCIFPEMVTPNHHALAQRFVLLDNFYVESEVSADGHEWSMAAYATDFVEKSWPLLYRGGLGKLKYPAEGEYAIAQPSSGYFWDQCRKKNVSYYSFGEFVDNAPQLGQPATTKIEALKGHFDPLFRSYDLDYPDQKRADRFLEKLKEFEATGEMPRFIVLRLPNDHTYGTRADKPTPTAMVADNDLALGRVIEALSQSKFWKELAVFVIQDDAQNGSDHVDAHRTVALAMSPYIRSGSVDSNLYSTASMLRTMELILGLDPMTQFDAAALPMYASFQAEPDLTPYTHRPTNVDLMAKNARDAWGAELSAKFDLSREDAADDLLLNEVVWRSVRGANSPMPPPVRASFVFQHVEEDEDED